MTFLKTYGLGAVGFTMMLSILAMELNIMVEWFVRILYGVNETPLPISVATLIDAEFAAATLMITFGALNWTSFTTTDAHHLLQPIVLLCIQQGRSGSRSSTSGRCRWKYDDSQ